MTTQTHPTNVYGMSRDTCTGCPATPHGVYVPLPALGRQVDSG